MHNEVISDAKKEILNLLDDGSFVEIDELIGAGVIAGYGTVNCRPICIFAQDSSVMSGAITCTNCEKICKTIDMAVKTGVPIVGVYDSIGAKIDEGVEAFVSLQKVLAKLSNASGVVPKIAIVLGSVTGIATFAVGFSDFVFMIDNKSKMFINGPQVVLSSTGKEVDGNEYGGAKVHFEKTGVCQFYCDDDNACLENVKKLFDFIPDNNLSDSRILDIDDENRSCDELLLDNVDAFKVIASICDNDFFEINSGFARNVIIGFGRIGGRACGIVANNSLCLDGKLNIDGIEKACKLVRFCDAFNIPIVTLIDNDGFEVSLEEEMNGVVRKGSRLLFAYSDATVPKINLIFGKAFGGANLMMGASPDIVLAWDSAKISVVNPITAVNVLFSDDITNADSPIDFRDEKLREYIENDANPKKSSGFIDSIISPSESRKRIISALDMFSGKREIKSVRRHESISF